MSRIRILHVVASSRGGGAVHVRDLVRGLDKACYDLQVALPDDGGNVSAGDLCEAGAAVHLVPLADGFPGAALHRLAKLARQVDILHLHGPRAALVGRLAVASDGRYRPNTVYTVHAFAAPHYAWPRSAALLALERILSSRTDAFVAVSYAERDALVTTGVAPPERISVVHNGVDLAHFGPQQAGSPSREATRSNLGIPVDALLTTMVSRLYRPRDFETLLIAFRQVREAMPSARLLIVGDGPYRKRVEELVNGLWLGQHVVLAGQRRDVPVVLATSDLAVHATSGWEGMGLSILEAMAAGLPVVASRVGGIPEAVIDGETGLLVPPGSPGALASALLRLLQDPRESQRLGTSGRARAEALFSLPRMVAETAAVYDRVLDGGRSALERHGTS